MKTTKIYSVAVIITLFFVQLSVYAQKKDDNKVVKLQTSAHSEMCKAKIEKTLAYEKGVIKSELDRETQILTVSYNPVKTDVSKIIKVITNLGHEAKEIIEKKEENKKSLQKQEIKKININD